MFEKRTAVCMKCGGKISSRSAPLHTHRIIQHIKTCRPDLLDMTVRSYIHHCGESNQLIGTWEEVEELESDT